MSHGLRLIISDQNPLFNILLVIFSISKQFCTNNLFRIKDPGKHLNFLIKLNNPNFKGRKSAGKLLCSKLFKISVENFSISSKF